MGSSMVNFPTLLLGIFVLHCGICSNGKTYAAVTHILDKCEDGSTSEDCQQNASHQDINEIEVTENELLEKISKAEDKKDPKENLMDSFINRVKGKGRKKSKELHDKAKGKNSLGNAENLENQIYKDIWDIGNKAQGCMSHHSGERGTIHFNADLTENPSACFWTISTTDSAFEITFQKFSMNICERLVIGDSMSSQPLAIFYGNTSEPGSIRLPHQRGYIMFLSSCQSNTAEFTLNWNTVEFGCNGWINNDYGMMHYPARITQSDLSNPNITYTNNENCTWVISASRPLQITFLRISTEECCDFLFVRDGTTSKSDNCKILAILRGNMLQSIVNTTSNSAQLQFTSDYSNVQRGFVMYWNVVEQAECGGIFNTESGIIRHPTSGNSYGYSENCTWIINSAISLEISFSSFDTEACCDHLSVRDGSSIGSTLLGRFSGSRLPTILRTMGDAHIQFTSDGGVSRAGFVLHWNISSSGGNVECGEHFNSDSGSIQYPDTGSTYPDSADCSWVIVSSGAYIELNFTSFSTENCCDFVYIRDGENSSAPLLGRYSGDTLPSVVRTMTNKAFIRFTSDSTSDSTESRTGFGLTWNTVVCGAVINDDSGTIRHPANGGNYRNSENCTWIIQASAIIYITFVRFNTEAGFDHLYIRDGEAFDSPVLKRFSGNNVPTAFRTRGNTALLHFTSDGSVTRTGFELQWDVVDCGGQYNSESGMIRHPMSGSNYRNSENCTWIIRASNPINITFVNFHTEDNFDLLSVRDGEFNDSPLIGRYSGSDFPATLVSNRNSMHIHFLSNKRITSTGFVLHWDTRECGEYFRSDSGEIRFPQNGVEYENNQHCVWIIETTGPLIEFTFASFSTELNYDNLTIRDGDNSESPLVGDFSGTFLWNGRTNTSQAYLSFTSDHSDVGAGFVIRWSTVATEGKSDCSCGSVNSFQEIIGGEEVEHKVKYPWHVGLFIARLSPFYFCGGTLISDKYVITAAHCLYPTVPADLMIQIGDHVQFNTTEDIEGITQAVSVEKVFIHPQFDRRILNQDFALLRLSRSIPVTDGFGIRPICLPLNDKKTFTGEQGLSVGWGRLNESSNLLPDTLQEVEMTILSPECWGWPQITPFMMCAYTAGQDTCQGDSGGSIVVVENGSSNGSDSSNIGTNEHYILAGVVSWGHGCAARTPGVYSRVTTALEWIQRFAITCNRRG